MKRKSLFAAFCIIALLTLPLTGMAKMTAMSESELNDVTGQAGIAVNIDHLNLDMTVDTLYYGDTDGIPEIGAGPGYISLCDMTLKGNVDFIDPMTINVSTQQTDFGTQLTSLDINVSDMTIDIDEFTIDAIRLGPEPGVGPSLGSFGIYGLHADVTGNVNISVRP